MSDEKKPTATVFDWLKDTIEKIRTLLISLGALVAAAITFYKIFVPSGPPPAPVPDPHKTNVAGCYRLDVIPQDKISISSVRSGDISKWFDLLFVNECTVDLMVRVEFKEVGGGIVIPPAPAERWPGYAIPAGAKIRKGVIPPNLEVLTEKPQVIQIRVSIYRKDNQELIGEDTCQIQMVA